VSSRDGSSAGGIISSLCEVEMEAWGSTKDLEQRCASKNAKVPVADKIIILDKTEL